MTSTLVAQTVVSGTIIDSGTKETLTGAAISVKGGVQGTITDVDGKFSLTTDNQLPFTLIISYIGYRTQEVVVTSDNLVIDVALVEESEITQEVIVSASRMSENIMQSPVTVERLDILDIKQAPTLDYYDALVNLKGVQVSVTSLNYTSVNARGFSALSNSRFVQLVDGIDTGDPTINAVGGAINTVPELDFESLELLPGAASALYGPNAFNGIMLLTSKNPFEYQGLSASIKQGITSSNAGGSNHLGQYAFRYAKALNDKFAFKINLQYLDATDWTANDYTTDRLRPESTVDLTNNQDFDGVNLFGDDFAIPIFDFGIGFLTRTGIKEEDLLDNNDAITRKGDLALHYRINERLELSGSYKYGGGRAIDQADFKYAYRDWSQQFIKLNLESEHFFVRSYVQFSNVDDTYNVGALGAYVNEYFNPTLRPSDGTGWINDYIISMVGYIPGNDVGDSTAARSYADRFMIDPETGEYVPSFQDTVEKIRNIDFQRSELGASLYSKSQVLHSEGYYNFNQWQWAEVIVGGNWRQYRIFSDATIYDEAPVDPDNPQRIVTNQYGIYVQAAKTLVEKLKLTASLRYDKMDDFDGHFTPRVSLVYSPTPVHNVRANFQTGFRFPDMIQQFIYFPQATGIVLGGVPSIASRYGVYDGGGWTLDSYTEFVSEGGKIDLTTGDILENPGNVDLVTANVPYLKPEQLWSFEIGYKGIIGRKLYTDINYYYTSYTDFHGNAQVINKVATSHQGQQINAGTPWQLYANSPYTLKSHGIGLGLSYRFAGNYVVSGNYTFTTFSGQQDVNFLTQFNTPKNRYNFGLGNTEVFRNFGFNVTFRYQDEFIWESAFGTAPIPAYGVVDAQISYKVPSIKTVLKLGATNIGGNEYRSHFGAPFVGQMYYLSFVFDEFLN